MLTTGHLNFVDLAGSESPKLADLEDLRAEERKTINLSNFVLGQVITALSKNNLPPYRDSKLTTLLRDSLGGKGVTVIITNITPSSHAYSKTICSLNYARQAQNISNMPREIKFKDIQEIIIEKTIEIESLKEEIKELERRLSESEEKFSKHAIIIYDDDFEKDSSNLQKAIKIKKHNMAKKESEKTDLENIATKSFESEESDDEIDEDIEILKKEHAQQIEIKQTEIEELKKLVEQKDSEIKKLNEMVTTSNDEIKKLKKELKSLKLVLEKKEVEIQDLTSENSLLKNELKQKEKEIKALKHGPTVIVTAHYWDEQLQNKINQDIKVLLDKKENAASNICNVL